MEVSGQLHTMGGRWSWFGCFEEGKNRFAWPYHACNLDTLLTALSQLRIKTCVKYKYKKLKIRVLTNVNWFCHLNSPM